MANYFTKWYFSRSGYRLAKLRELHPLPPRIELLENGNISITLVDNQPLAGNMRLHLDAETAKALAILLTNKLVEGVTKQLNNNEQDFTTD